MKNEEYKMDLSKRRNLASSYFIFWIFFLFFFFLSLRTICYDVITTEISTFLLFVSAGVSFESAFSLCLPSANPKLFNLNQAYPSKKLFFSGEILINLLTSFIKMLVTKHASYYMTTSTISFESDGKILLVTSWTKNNGVISFILKYLYFKKT